MRNCAAPVRQRRSVARCSIWRQVPAIGSDQQFGAGRCRRPFSWDRLLGMVLSLSPAITSVGQRTVPSVAGNRRGPFRALLVHEPAAPTSSPMSCTIRCRPASSRRDGCTEPGYSSSSTLRRPHVLPNGLADLPGAAFEWPRAVGARLGVDQRQLRRRSGAWQHDLEGDVAAHRMPSQREPRALPPDPRANAAT